MPNKSTKGYVNMIQLQWNALNRWRSQKMSYKQMLVYKKLWLCYAHWAGIQEKWVTLSGVWKANGSTENWTLDIVWSIIVLETRFTQTARWHEFVLSFLCFAVGCGLCSDNTKFRKRFLQRCFPVCFELFCVESCWMYGLFSHLD